MKRRIYCLWALFITLTASAKEYHVAVNGADDGPGSKARPFRTISQAAREAMPGDTITVHAGVYRERVSPVRGGMSEETRIVYRAAPGEKVEIKGSEIIKDWQPLQGGIWKIVIPDGFFGGFNPYTDLIVGDWYFGKNLHTGEVYLDGKCLHEVDAMDKVSDPKNVSDPVGVDPNAGLDGTYVWYCAHQQGQTTIYANFHDGDPNRSVVEINVRSTCFCPGETGRNYITVQGFDMSQAATQWAAPTAEQIGIIGTNWSKGWIIERNAIHDSKCVGITLGKDRASGHNVWSKDRSKDGSVLYDEMTRQVAANGWSRTTIGSHIVRNNTVYNCGAAGICGSFGAAYSQILDNHIYDIYTYRPYWGAEMGGIKIHAAIDVLIKGNKVHNCYQGIWLDWMAQGTRVCANLCFNNDYVDFFPEVDHGPYLVDNNLFLSGFSIKDWSEGGAYAHNFIAGMISRAPQVRATPYFRPHTTEYVASKSIRGGDNRWYNNIFCGTGGAPVFKRTKYMVDDAIDPSAGYGLSMYDSAALPTAAEGNVYFYGALPFKGEKGGGGADLKRNNCVWVTTDLLGRTTVAGGRYENPDGSPLDVDTDYLGYPRNRKELVPGPFSRLEASEFILKMKL